MELSMGYDPIDALAGIYWPQIDHKRSIYGNAQRVIDANHPFMVQFESVYGADPMEGHNAQ